MTRLTTLMVLAGAGFVLSPSVASAQFGYGYPSAYGAPRIVPSFNPFFYVPQYRYQSFSSLNVQTMYGSFSLGTRQYYYGVTNPAWALAPAYPTFYAQGGSYISGGSARPNLALEAQRDLARAQRAMGLPGAYGSSSSGSASGSAGSTSVVPAAPTIAGSEMPEGFEKALAPAERARVLSGASLNELLAAIVKAEPKGGERASAFVSPLQLEEVRFGGSDAADALNLALRPLDFPVAFDEPALKDLRLQVARDFAPIATALQAGKAPDAVRREQFEVTVQKVQAALPSVIKGLPFADATAAQRFVNQLANTNKALKANAASGLINPKWGTEGTTVAEMVSHMNRHKLRFAAAPAGNEETYTSLHRNFATYLFLLTQPKK